MSYEDRLKDMIEKGTLNAQQARAFQESLEKLPPAADVKKPMPMTGISLALVGALAVGATAICVSTASQSAAPDVIQNVAQSMNQQGATGNLGATTTSVMTMFLLFAVPFSGVTMFLANAYNRVVGFDAEASKTEAFVAAALQRRRDLIPQLQGVAKQAMTFEETLQSSVTEQRAHKAQDFSAVLGDIEHADKLLPHLSAVVEAYPQLKTFENTLQLQAELSRIEDGILIARNIHAAALADLNAEVRSVFGSLAAKLAGVRERYNATVNTSASAFQ